MSPARAPGEHPPHRSSELTRPIKLSPWTIAVGVLLTAGMFAMLGYGISRESRSGRGDFAPLTREQPATTSGLALIARRFPGYRVAESRMLVFVDRAGNVRPAARSSRDFHSPRFSPDGRLVLVDFSDESGRDAWVLAIARGVFLRATFARDAHDAVWTSSGQEISYTSYRTGPLGVYRGRPTSESPPELLLTDPSLRHGGEWLPGDAGLLTTIEDTATGSTSRVALVERGGRGPIVSIGGDSSPGHSPALSPDGRWVAYVSMVNGDPEIFVRPWQRDGPAIQVSLTGGREPVWNPDGGELFYRGAGPSGPALFSASIGTGRSFSVTGQRILFPLRDMVSAAPDPHANYDMAPDGSTFVMVQRVVRER